MAGKGIAAVALVAVVVMLIGSMMVPAIKDWALEEQTITNDDPGWLHMERIAYQRNYTVSVSIGADISIALDAASPQTGNDDTILYADSNMAVWVQDGTAYVTGNDHGTRVFSALDSDFTITHTINDPVTVDDGIVSFNFGSPEWAYLPVVTGDWAFYDNGTTVSYKDETTPLAVGTFAGLGCYSTFISQAIPVVMDVSGDVSSVQWIKGDTIVPIDNGGGIPDLSPMQIEPGSITPIPGNPGAIIMQAPPTPTYTDGDWGYNLDGDNNATIVSYSGSAGTITVPATVGGYDVIAVGLGTNNNPVIDTELGASDIVISSGIQAINGYAFKGTAITSITIPSSVTSIGQSAFQGCTSLASATLPDGLTVINSSVFYGCTSLASVTIPSSVTSIGQNAFQNCTSLASVTIPSNVTSIGTYAFRAAGLTSITIPSSVTSIGNNAFNYCASLASVTIQSGVTTIGNNVFQNCTSLASVTIPSSVTSIGQNAFQGCTSLASVTLQDGLTVIGATMFSGCTSLASVTIPSSVTSIGQNAFQNCTSLASVTIPSNVTSIGNYAFQNCTSLASVTLQEGLTIIGNYMFSGCTSLASITIPSSIITVGNTAYNNCTNLSKIITLTDKKLDLRGGLNIQEFLNLGSAEYTTADQGLTNAVIDDHIESIGYLAQTQYTEYVPKDGGQYTFALVIPIIIIIVLLVAVAASIGRRD